MNRKKDTLFICLITLFVISLPFSGFCLIKGKTANGSLVKTDSVTLIDKDSIALSPNEKLGNQVIKVFISNNSNYFKDLLPILSLLIGIFINRGLDYFTNRKKIKKTGERWKAELSCIELPIKKQIDFLKKFLEEHEKESFITPKLTISTALNGEAFTSLDKTDLIKYLERFKGKNYSDAVNLSNRINSFVGILKFNYDNLNIKFNEYLSETSSLITNLNASLQSLLKAFGQYSVQLELEIKGDPLDDPRYRPVFDLFNAQIFNEMRMGNSDIYEMEKHFFAPLIMILGELRLDSRTYSMTDYTSSCLNLINRIKMEKKYLSQNVNILTERYGEESKELASLVTEIL